MNKFKQIQRLMGFPRETMRQKPQGTRLERFMSSVDPYDQEREESEMDMYEREGPIVIETDEDGNVVNEAVGQTARTPRGDEDHALQGTIVATELIPR
jgi:hypothetical protein